MMNNPDKCLLNNATQLQWDKAHVVISPDMKNNDRKTVFDTQHSLFFLKLFTSDRHIFPQKTHVVRKIEIYTAIVSQTCMFCI